MKIIVLLSFYCTHLEQFHQCLLFLFLLVSCLQVQQKFTFSEGVKKCIYDISENRTPVSRTTTGGNNHYTKMSPFLLDPSHVQNII